MGLTSRVLGISAGVFIGGGLGFYWRETYYVRRMEERARTMEGDLVQLRERRRKMEMLLRKKE